MNNKRNQPPTISASQFFEFRYAPFADTVEINEPFQSDAEALIVQRALALIRQGKSLALYGEAGTGKSMLIKTIAGSLDAKTYRLATLPYGGLKPSAIVRELCEYFDIDTSGRKNLLCRLTRDFQRSSEKPFPVIIVDDAHGLQHQSFIDLCSLLHDAQSRTAAASLLLVGQPVLRKMLELDIFAPVRTRLAYICMMPKLSIDEAKSFIQFRLAIAEADPRLFDEEALECLATDSNGNRRILMNIATMCLEEAARRKEKTITSEIVSTVSLQFSR